LIEANGVEKESVACALFTTTPDLDAEFPAVAARQLGWMETPLLCGQEINVALALPRCLRILILFNTEKKAEDIVHVYIRGAEVLRQGETAEYNVGKLGGRENDCSDEERVD
jgi:chorismate mutase